MVIVTYVQETMVAMVHHRRPAVMARIWSPLILRDSVLLSIRIFFCISLRHSALSASSAVEALVVAPSR